MQRYYFIICATNYCLYAQDDSAYDNGFFSSCDYLQLLDLTISSGTAESLNLNLNIGKPNEFHVYPINRSTSILTDSYFKRDFKTVMFVHGFIESTTDQLSQTIISAYSTVGGYNIIVVDANPFTWVSYLRAARAARDIGNRLGRAIYSMSRRGLNISNFTLIGHSVGAHICGFAGKAFRKKSKTRLPFIVTLDPAGPCFRSVPKNERVSANDAKFVEVIHTNGVGLGLMNAVGKVDFYFNGGRFQNTYTGEKCGSICSHLTAVSIWSDSVVNNYKFLGVQCTSVAELDNGYCHGGRRNRSFLGPATTRNTTGVYLVQFRRTYSYCESFKNYYTGIRNWFGFNYNYY